MRISVEDARGNPLAVSRDPAVLTRVPRPRVNREALERLRSRWEREDVTDWDWGGLSHALDVPATGGARVPVFVALNREDERVALRLYTDEREALRRHIRGVAALYERHFARQLRDFRAGLTLPLAMRGTAQYFGGEEALYRQVWDEVARELFAVPVRTREEFLAHAEEVAPKIHGVAAALLEQLELVLRRYRDARDVILRLGEKHAGNAAVAAFLSARRADLDQLVPREFVHRYGLKWLHYVERYVLAVQVRAERGVTNLPRDREREAVLAPYLASYQEMQAQPADEAARRGLEEFHLLLQEFAVSLFAQDLKTHVRVSEKLLRAKMREIDDQ
jgi:ATP-dependent helicase HrpA